MGESTATISSVDAVAVIGLTAVVAGYALADRTDLPENKMMDKLIMSIRDWFARQGLLPADADSRALARALGDMNHRFRVAIGEES